MSAATLVAGIVVAGCASLSVRPSRMLEAKSAFELSAQKPLESAKLVFKGTEGWDVYNCSVPFRFDGGRYIFGRVEKHEKWVASHIALFRETAKDEWTRDERFNELELEDPYVQIVKGELVVGDAAGPEGDGGLRNLAYLGVYLLKSCSHNRLCGKHCLNL